MMAIWAARFGGGGMASLLERYRAGDRAGVWADLDALGGRVREGQILGDALAVTRQAMERVRANVVTLISRLDAIGYHFRATREPTYCTPGDFNPFTGQRMPVPPKPWRRQIVYLPPGL